MRGIPLFRIAGIRIEAHWTALVTAVLLTVMLGGAVIPQLAPDVDQVERWLIAPIGAIGFLATLLAHELAHSVTARRAGVHIDRITLWLLGGVSEMHNEPDDPRTDLRIALAGPATSIAIGVGLFAAIAAVSSGFSLGLIGAVVGWLAATNVVLAVFNLLPAMPLDGGRVLRDIIWIRTGDQLRAASIAARGGRYLGVGLIALGICEVVFLASAAGMWLVLLGLFLRSAAGADLAAATARHQLGSTTVAEVMTAHPFTVLAGTSVEDFLRSGLPTWHRVFPVIDASEHPIGVVSLLELARRPHLRRDARVESVAHALPPAAKVTADTPMTTLLSTVLLRPGLDLVAVVDDANRLIGVVTATDLVTASARSALGIPVSHMS
ncbi:site-2 protease family protein [Smaragdicoccus niigatensis]|uniref:site-2 protease family protein n=1 Tax=Smaragdicoccus niigatensis TaxID=359359 RepID=UPI0003652BD5|nr:site-2 protease family protein [Smaragdicoccus niigatensis]